jgi:Family of unknown function (DUF6807)
MILRRFIAVSFLITFFSLYIFSQKVELLHFFVESGNYQRINTPVSLSLEGLAISDTASYQLFEVDNDQEIEKKIQVEWGYSPRLWLILDGITSVGTCREFYLYSTVKRQLINSITTEVTSRSLILKKDNSDILHYQTAIHYPPPGVDTIYKRNGFIHPVITPAGNILTRVNPPDHFHHLGIWNPWTKVRIGNHVTDFWNLNERQGTVRFAGINSTYNGSVFGGFSVRQEHIDFQGKKEDEVAINEVWDVRAWNVEPLENLNAFLVDLTTFLSVEADSAIVFEAYRYGGGIGIRANEEWTKDNSTVLTSEGKTRIDADGTRARWTDLNGVFKNSNQSGIVFLSHPSNREYPEPMRVWPIDANEGRGDVYFEFCPIRYKDWTLEPGNVYRLKYRMLLYDGEIDNSIAERIWNDFAFPPVVKVLSSLN